MPATIIFSHAQKIAPDDMEMHTKAFKDYTDLKEGENKSRVPLALKDALAVRLGSGFSTMCTDDLYERTRKYVDPSWDVVSASAQDQLRPGRQNMFKGILRSSEQGPHVPDSHRTQDLIVRDFMGEKVPENTKLPYRTKYCWYSVKDTLYDPSTYRKIQKLSTFGPDGSFRKFDYIGAMEDRLLVAKNEQQLWVTEYTDPQGKKVTTLDQFPTEIAGPVQKWIEEHSKPLSEQSAAVQSISEQFSSNVTVGGFHKSFLTPL